MGLKRIGCDCRQPGFPKHTHTHPHGTCNKPLIVYAYGVKPLYGGMSGTHFDQLDDGTILLYDPYAYLHYWIDAGFNYHEKVMKSDIPPKLLFRKRPGYKVTLNGPQDYTIEYSGH